MPGVGEQLSALRLQRGWQPVPLREPVPVDALPTPALIVEVAQLEANLQRMNSFLAARGKRVRAHAKMHKCPIIAHRQIALGAVGICAAKLAEAEVLRAAGVFDLLVTSPLATRDKMQRAVQLSILSEGRAAFVIDDMGSTLALADLARQSGAQVAVLVDIDPDLGRTGVRGGDGVLRLIEAVGTQPSLRFLGLQQYAGQVMHIKGHGERARRSVELWQSALAIRQRVIDAGVAVGILTGGGTGSYDIDCDLPHITDLQVGSYAFMDEEYLQIGSRDGDRFDDFAPSLFVLATAISQPRAGAVTLDAGYKSFAAETVPPVPVDLPGTKFRFAGDEHGVLLFDKDSAGRNELPRVGDRVRLVTSHCDPTVNLYDYLFPVVNGMVSELWPIAARGCSW